MRIGPAGRGRGGMDRNNRGGPMMRGRFVTFTVSLWINYVHWYICGLAVATRISYDWLNILGDNVTLQFWIYDRHPHAVIIWRTDVFGLLSPLSSTRQHPSYGDCLEVKREYYQNCSVLDCVTQCLQSAAHLCEHSSCRSNRLGLSHWDPYAVRRGSCLELYYCNMVEWFWSDSSLISTTKWFPSVLWHCWFGHLCCKNLPWNDR